MFAQNVLLHLAHGVAGKFVHEEHLLGQLELGKTASSAWCTSASLRLAPGVRTITAVTPSPKSLCGRPNDGAFQHARQSVDLAFHFLRIDVEAAGDDEILAAPDDVDIATGVDLAEIAGDEEASWNSDAVFSGSFQ